jgi:H+-transporting ATPase
MGLPPSDYPHIITAIYLKVSISDFLTLFSARTQTKPFFAYGPSAVLLVGACGSLALSSIVASFWPESSPDEIRTVGLVRLSEGQPAMASQRLMPVYVWMYCIGWWFVQDWIKVLSYVLMERFDIFSYRTFMNPDGVDDVRSPNQRGATSAEPLLNKRRSIQ